MNRNNSYIFTPLFVAALLMFNISLHAQDKAPKLLQALQHKFNSLTSITADFTQSFDNGKKLDGKLYYKKKDNIRIETAGVILISDGTTTWNYNTSLKKLIISSNSPDEQSLLSLRSIVNNIPPKCDVKYAGDNNGTLILTPKEKGMDFGSIRLSVNKSNLIETISIETIDKHILTVELSNYKINSKLPDSLFKIIPPKGSKVIDLR